MTAEAKLLSALCQNKDIVTVLNSDVDEMFMNYGDMWKWLRNYYMKYQSVPDSSVLKEEFPDFEPVDVDSNTTFYVDGLRDEFITTNLKKILYEEGKSLGKVAGAQLLENLSSKLTVLAKDMNIVKDRDITDTDVAVATVKAKAEKFAESGSGVLGIPTGLKVFDTFYPTGLAPGQLIVVIGWSGRGKSWFATYLACRAWSAGYKPMIVSLEMSPEEVADRAYTIMASGLFKNSDLTRGDVDVEKFRKWSTNELADKQEFIVVSSEGMNSVTPSTVQAKIDQYKPDIVFLDYQQLFDSDIRGLSEVEKNKSISRGFKRIAMANNIPVVNLSQATQDNPKDTEEAPLIEQVAWSKSIQHDANLAIAVHKMPDSDLMEVIARKNRHGELFEFHLDWDIDNGIAKEIY